MTMDELARALGRLDEVPIVDRTGLEGVYQFTLTFPDTFTPRNSLLVDRGGNPIAPLGSSGLSMFKAVEALGLQLQEQKIPFEFLVVQQIRRVPTEN